VASTDLPVALRSYPRRFRAVLVRPDDEEPPAAALAEAATAAAMFETAAEGLRLAAIQERAMVRSLAPKQADDPLPDLAEGAERVAAATERIKGGDWQRPVVVDVYEGSALDLGRMAVHAGVHHLRAAERAVEDALRAR
jgi:hypothetical protein